MGGFYISNPMMIAHRGTTKNFPENTVEAYSESIKLGYSGIELDILSSKDGVIYCSHNHQLEREMIHVIHSNPSSFFCGGKR